MNPQDQNSNQPSMSPPNVPAQPIKQGGKGPIIAIVILIIVALAGIGITWYLVNSSSQKQAQQKDEKINELNTKIQELNTEVSKLKESQTPSTAQNDQTSILNSIKALYKDKTANLDAEIDKKYFTDAYYNTLTTGQFAADPILCAQNIIEYDKLVFNNPVISGTNATMSIKTQYGTTININLVKQNNSWLVSSVTCPTN